MIFITGFPLALFSAIRNITPLLYRYHKLNVGKYGMLEPQMARFSRMTQRKNPKRDGKKKKKKARNT